MSFQVEGPEIFFIVLWFIQFIASIIGTCVIVSHRARNQSIKARAPILAAISSLGSSFYLASYVLSYSVPSTPCAIMVFVANVSFYVLWAPILLRAWRIYYVFFWNSRQIKEQEEREKEIAKQNEDVKRKQQLKKQSIQREPIKEIVVELKDVALDPLSPTATPRLNNNESVTSTTNTAAALHNSNSTNNLQQASVLARSASQLSLGNNNNNNGTSSMVNNSIMTPSTTVSVGGQKNWREFDLQSDIVTDRDVEDIPELMEASEATAVEIVRKSRKKNKRNIYKRRAEESNLVKFFFVMLLVVIVILIPVSLAFPRDCPHDFLCQINERPTNNILMNGILFPRLVVPAMIIVDIMLFVEVIMLRGVNDSYGLNIEFRIITVIAFIGTIIYIAMSFTNVSFIFVLMMNIWMIFIQSLFVYYPTVLVFIHLFKKNDLTTTNQSMKELSNVMEIPNSIEKMLENEQTRKLFKNHLVKALCSESILFYEDVLQFKKASNEERQQMAPSIIENYIKDDALNEINIAGKIKKKIISKYNQTNWNDEIPVDLFDLAVEKLKLVLNENGTYQAFLDSSDFKKFVKKMKEQQKLRQIEDAGGVV
ncbi:hypothetical protein ABK040_014258 [Willaertia magna]